MNRVWCLIVKERLQRYETPLQAIQILSNALKVFLPEGKGQCRRVFAGEDPLKKAIELLREEIEFAQRSEEEK